MAGAEMAGAILCRRLPDMGWISQVAVLRPWRRRGTGLQLLRHAFADYYHGGIHKVSLSVDEHNPTGAHQLYEQAGMYISLQVDTLQKPI
jgi:mycothiol synthase